MRKESLDDFSPEWCQKLLNNPSYEQTGAGSRTVGGPTGKSSNSLIGKTLFTDHTLRAIRFLYKPKANEREFGGELLALVSLGDEICSHANVLHGGINTTIIDEVSGGLAMRESVPHSLMAVNFTVKLRKSVKTPGIVLVRAWLDRKPEGRKVWVKCRTEQDGITCIESESLYLHVGMSKARL
ncbi:hypothetical protein LTR37_002453 [Vermiconidia calcicola]|uniref:Uncharacterized protein n=1 Tax=Vermiconidia calcicola TaxID=1690605 RepID=A0ACC3NSW0_9PEZI|nr:hypothetical protein LTR37_002453 [Vermiconidia calcicola]